MSAPFRWKKSLPITKVKKVQENCKTAMKFWGYKMATEADLANEDWNPLTNWQLTYKMLECRVRPL